MSGRHVGRRVWTVTDESPPRTAWLSVCLYGTWYSLWCWERWWFISCENTVDLHANVNTPPSDNSQLFARHDRCFQTPTDVSTTAVYTASFCNYCRMSQNVIVDWSSLPQPICDWHVGLGLTRPNLSSVLSTVSVSTPYLFSPLSLLAERDICFCRCFFIFVKFLMVEFYRPYLKIYWTDRHQMFIIGRRMGGLDKLVFYFAIPQGMLPWQPILEAKSATYLYQSWWHSKKKLQYRNSDFKRLSLNDQIFSLLCRNCGGIRSSNPEITMAFDNILEDREAAFEILG